MFPDYILRNFHVLMNIVSIVASDHCCYCPLVILHFLCFFCIFSAAEDDSQTRVFNARMLDGLSALSSCGRMLKVFFKGLAAET